jgi:hypothetical protein
MTHFPSITSEYNTDADETEELWNAAIQHVYETFDLEYPFFVYENGFEDGDAGEDEVIACAIRLGLHEEVEQDDDSGYDEASEWLFGKLNAELERKYRELMQGAEEAE